MLRMVQEGVSSTGEVMLPSPGKQPQQMQSKRVQVCGFNSPRLDVQKGRERPGEASLAGQPVGLLHTLPLGDRGGSTVRTPGRSQGGEWGDSPDSARSSSSSTGPAPCWLCALGQLAFSLSVPLRPCSLTQTLRMESVTKGVGLSSESVLWPHQERPADPWRLGEKGA